MMKQRLTIIIWLCTGLLALASFNQTVLAKNNNKISITVNHMDIAELYEMLSRQNKVNILLSDGVESEVSVNLYNVSVKEAIYAVAQAAGYVVERHNNSYIISKSDTAGKTIAGGLKQIRTYKIQYSNIKKVADILENHLSRFGQIDILEERGILLVEDLPDFLDQIEPILLDLDHEPAQILIEARILNITLDDSQDLGVDWSRTFTSKDGKGSFGNNGFAESIVSAAASGAVAGPPGFFFTYMNDKIEVTLTALNKKGKVQALSTPKLLALEHQEAQVIIGERTGYRVTTTINQVTQESVQFIESGVILKVTPSIDRFGRIMMDIHPEVSKTTLKDGIPSLTTTEVSTRLLVQDGQTAFIGGLIRNDLTSDHSGVPLLEDIPIIGALFSKSNDFSSKTETVVIIKPQIIRPEQFSLITHKPQERIEHFDQKIDNNAQHIDDFLTDKTKLTWDSLSSKFKSLTKPDSTQEGSHK